MWSAFFPTAKVVGLDVNEECKDVCADNPNIEIRIADATRAPQPELFDIILDEGSHLSGHIVQSYKTHWPRLKPGGFYIIEDLACTRDRDYGIAALAVYRLPVTKTRMALRSTLMKLFDDELRALDRGQSECEFCHFYQELCIIRKRA